MNLKKNHHVVPKLLLRNFTNERNKLWWFRKGAGLREPHEQSPDSVFYSKHFHTLREKDKEPDISLEEDLGKLESDVKPMFSRLIESVLAGLKPNMTDQERYLCVFYIYMQWKRTPESIGPNLVAEKFVDYRDDAIARLRFARPDLENEIEDWLNDEDAQKRAKANTRVSVIRRVSPEVDGLLRKLSIGVGYISLSNKAFVIGSNPVIKLTTPESSELGDPGVGAWLPIAKNVVLCTAEVGTETHVFSIDDPNWIRDFNLITWKQSQEIAGHSKELISSLSGVRKDSPK